MNDHAERDLIARAQAGDAAAERELVAANVGLAYMVAGDLARGPARDHPVGFDDLGQDGVFALHDAVRGFNLDRRPCTPFAGYAKYVIRNHLVRRLVEGRTCVRVPYRAALAGGGVDVRGDLAASPPVVVESDPLAATESTRRLDDAFRMLAPLDRLILRRRYRLTPGDAPGPVRSQPEVAGELGISSTQVRAIERRALRLLREDLSQ